MMPATADRASIEARGQAKDRARPGGGVRLAADGRRALRAATTYAYEASPGTISRRREVPAEPRSRGATSSLQPHEIRVELACGARHAGADDELIGPYKEGFAAFASGSGLADNPYPADRCAHLHWANGWSQARDEAQRRAR
ncbi:MAG TPA: hypothetical protein VFV80_06290 [Geminicoccaceae bacterium]|nr:hypothetical protein [Geminicoccaceae bacterium]